MDEEPTSIARPPEMGAFAKEPATSIHKCTLMDLDDLRCIPHNKRPVNISQPGGANYGIAPAADWDHIDGAADDISLPIR